MPTAAVEVLVLFAAVALATLLFAMGWFTPNEGVVLTALLLVLLVALSWKNFNQGRHPCFLFLGMLLLLQGGRLITYCLGSESYPLRIAGMSPFPFDLAKGDSGLALLCVATSAICVYAPCRLNYRNLAPPATDTVKRYLPYLYLIFYTTLPIQLYKNYSYYRYVQEHGGYAYFFVNHVDVASTVPLLVRAIVLLNFPAFVAIFVFERRKKLLWLAAVSYFATASLVLLMGARGAIFTLALTLWYVAGVKSGKRSRIVAVAGLAVALVLVGDIVQSLREDSDSLAAYTFAPVEFVKLQGNSLDVTEVSVAYRSVFAPFAPSYMWNELKDAFVANDTTNYFRGKVLAFDVPVFLDSRAFSLGHGTGSAYIAEAYVIGGLVGVILISVLIGFGLHTLYKLSHAAVTLFFVALIFPEVLTLPRAALLDWLSVLLKMCVTVGLLFLGWQLYVLLRWLGNGIQPSTRQAEASR